MSIRFGFAGAMIALWLWPREKYHTLLRALPALPQRCILPFRGGQLCKLNTRSRWR